MTTTTPTVSIRVPEPIKSRLDRMAKKMRRSRSSLMIEALDRHLDVMQQEQAVADTQGRFAEILKFKGAGAVVSKPRSVKEIDAAVRDFRGDE